MASDQLLSYLNDSLENLEVGLKQNDVEDYYTPSIPNEGQTVALIDLLKEKLEKENKSIYKNEAGNRTKRKRDFEHKILEAKYTISQLTKKSEILFERKCKLEQLQNKLEQIQTRLGLLFKELWDSFQKLNKLDVTIKQFLQILTEAKLVSIAVDANPTIEKEEDTYFLCEEDILLEINILIVFKSSFDDKTNRLRSDETKRLPQRNEFLFYSRKVDSEIYEIERFWHELFERKAKSIRKFPRKHYFSLEKFFVRKDNRLECISENLNEFVDKIISLGETTNNSIVEDNVLMETESLLWTILPPGKNRLELTINHFNKLKSTGNWTNKSFDQSRLEIIERFLKPIKCYIGFDGFEGYVIYLFNYTNKVVLECPIYANAIYVLNEGWQEIAKLSKWEIRHNYASQVTTINHSDTWFNRLKENLESKN
jgi:hypothetical protein